MEVETILLYLAIACGFYMAWSIGANDVANAMGTSVGSGALTIKRAVIIAAILEFAGAFLMVRMYQKRLERELLTRRFSKMLL